jgi:hypothetical protein
MNRILSNRLFISPVISFVIIMQASTFVTGTQIWPFMAYCMYSNSVKNGTVRTDRAKVMALLENGDECEITPALAGLDFFGFLKVFLADMQVGNEEQAKALRERMAPRVGQSIKSMRVETELFDLANGRLSRQLTIKTYDFD